MISERVIPGRLNQSELDAALTQRDMSPHQMVSPNMPDFDAVMAESNAQEQANLAKEREAIGGKEIKVGETKNDREFREMLERVTGRRQDKLKNQMEKDDFLNLMVVQLRNQDPTKPMEHQEMATQLAQFNTVEQLLAVNKRLTELAEGQKQLMSERSLNYIGQMVDVKGNAIDFRNHEQTTLGAFKIDTACQNIVAMIKNDKGDVVRSLTLGKHEPGKYLIPWDGINDQGQKVPDGRYEFVIQASTPNGKMVNVEDTFSRTTIVGMTDLAQGGKFETSSGQMILPQDVQSIVNKETGSKMSKIPTPPKPQPVLAASDHQVPIDSGGGNLAAGGPGGTKLKQDNLQDDIKEKGINMTIIQAMYNGVSGLSTNSDGMSVIANNIANANTKGFKGDRAEFEDILSVNLNENSQIGRGARLRNTSILFNQGAITSTGVLTDLAMQNDGFFVVKSEFDNGKNNQGQFYTRQGAFRFDKDGKLTDAVGQKVQGYMADDRGRLATRTSDVEIISNIIPPRGTNVVNMVLNLDAREKAPKIEFSPENIREASNFVTSITIYDSFGTGHQGEIYFRRGEDPTKNEWNWSVAFNPSELGQEPAFKENGEIIPLIAAQGKLDFDDKGKPVLPFVSLNGDKTYIDTIGREDGFDITFAGGAKPQRVQFNFGPQIDEDTRTVGTVMSSSAAASSILNFAAQDGYEAGNLKSIRVTRNGMIHGIYTNGLDRRLAALAVAIFPNNNGLQKVGNNNYIHTPKAGVPRIGTAETGSRGSVFSSSLEESNVDIASEFVNMIVTQRAFQANSRSVTTSDTMIEEVLNLKR